MCNSKKYYVGIDISKKTLDVCLYDSGNFLPENYCCIKNDLSGFKSLVKWFKSNSVDIKSVVVCLEHTGVYGLDISFFLEENGISYVMVSGYAIKHSLGLIRGKNDKVDSRRIAEYCYLFREKHVYSKMQSKSFLRIRELMSERRLYVKRQSQCKSYITEHKLKGDNKTKDRCLSELKCIDLYIKEIEKEVLDLIRCDSCLDRNYNLLISVIGVSFVNAVNALLYTDNFTGFLCARAYACYCGVAPFSYQSGTSIHSSSKVSKMSNKMLKVDLSSAAVSAVTHDPVLRAYYMRKLLQGKHKGTVLNAVKFKLIERMFTVVRRGEPYVKLGSYIS